MDRSDIKNEVENQISSAVSDCMYTQSLAIKRLVRSAILAGVGLKETFHDVEVIEGGFVDKQIEIRKTEMEAAILASGIIEKTLHKELLGVKSKRKDLKRSIKYILKCNFEDVIEKLVVERLNGVVQSELSTIMAKIEAGAKEKSDG